MKSNIVKNPVYKIELKTVNGVEGLEITHARQQLIGIKNQYVKNVDPVCANQVKFIPLTVSGGEDKDEQELSISGTSVTISGGNTLDFSQLIKDGETLTTLDSIAVNGTNLEIKYTGEDGTQVTKSADLKSLVEAGETLTSIAASGKKYQYTKEDGTIDNIQAGTFISADTGNAIATGSDGGLMLTIPAQLPDDQLLSGDNSGNIDITLTPDTQPDGSVDYLLKADLPLATTTPSNKTNALKLDANSKFFVEPETVTSFSGLLTTGTKIGTYTKEDGTTQDIFAPSGGSAADGSETKVNAGTNVTVTGSGTSASPYVINSASFVQSNTRFVATANQTSFTLSFTPLGVVQFFRNGAAIDSLAFSVSGTTLTYVPSNNGNTSLGALVAGDIINVYGISK